MAYYGYEAYLAWIIIIILSAICVSILINCFIKPFIRFIIDKIKGKKHDNSN